MMGRISLLAFLAAGLIATATLAENVTFEASSDVMLWEREVPVDLTLRLTDIGATRISIESILDLRRAQKIILSELTDKAFVDTCNAKISATEVVAGTDDTALTLGGRIEAKFFRCEGQFVDKTKRGEEIFTGSLTVGISASAEFRDDCLYFSLLDLKLKPDRLSKTAEEEDNVEKVRDILFKFTDVILEKSPVCPELPPELTSLSPSYDAGGTREIGENGIGLFFQGSLDASTVSIIDILQVLQSKGVLPPPPK